MSRLFLDNWLPVHWLPAGAVCRRLASSQGRRERLGPLCRPERRQQQPGRGSLFVRHRGPERHPMLMDVADLARVVDGPEEIELLDVTAVNTQDLFDCGVPSSPVLVLELSP